MSLHLSRLLLNPASAAARADLRNLYDLHRTLSRGFGDDPEAYRQARCLFRLEELKTPPQVLVQSLHSPDWDGLPDRYLVQTAEVKETRLDFEAGCRLRFLLLANPTRREPGGNVADPETGKAKDGPRRALVSKDPAETERACREWLKRKGEAGGFLPLFFDVEDCGVREVCKGGKRIPYAAIRFEGVLRVTDPERLLVTLGEGIGAAKGFGFGLLSLGPA